MNKATVAFGCMRQPYEKTDMVTALRSIQTKLIMVEQEKGNIRQKERNYEI